MDRSDARDVEKELGQLVDRPEIERAGYLMELGWSRSGQSTPGVLPYLEDPVMLVRIAAAQARWQTEPRPEELDRLVRILVEGLASGDGELALTAGTVLVNMGEPVVAPLVRAFEDCERRDVLIVRVVGEIGGDEAMGFLRSMAESDNPEVAEEAVEALEALAEEEENGAE